MINFITSDGKKRFEINEDRLYEEDLTVIPALLALSVNTPADWEALYEKTDQALQKEKQIVEEQQATIEKQKTEIDEKIRQIEGMNDEIVEKQNKIDLQNNDIIFQKYRLYELVTDISDQQKVLRNKTLILDSQNQQIEAQKNILQQQVDEISGQELKIRDQKSAMVQQLERIHIQSLALALFITLLVLIIILGYFIWRAYRIKKQAHRELEVKNSLIVAQNAAIELEKDKSDRLLLNILPVRVANDLKMKGRTDPQVFHNVSVMFTDIVGFTKVSSGYGPQRLIDELNELFTAFDNIMETNGCERIKTIGDAYLAVCGMPVENPRHAERMTQAAMDILDYLNHRNVTSEIKWKVRIGVHSGDVVGGVVGVKKYIYDVFGDTINTASRMESHSEPMMINVSEPTYSLIKDAFIMEKREGLHVKGKGMMNMYFLRGKN
jgi:class 3 adenylate cyclase